MGVGLAIVGGIAAQQKAKQKAKQKKAATKKVTKPKKTKKVVKKTTKKTPKKNNVVRKSKPPAPGRIALPETIRIARPKQRAYTIGDKPWASEDEFVVVLEPGLTQQEVLAFLDEHRLTQKSLSRISLLDRVVLKLEYPEDMSPRDALAMATDPRISRAQLDYFYYPANDPAASTNADFDPDLQYALAKMGLGELGGAVGGKGVALAVIDSGVHGEHPSLLGKETTHFSAFPSVDPLDLNTDHGTAIASIIAAQNGMKGIAGEVDLMSAQVFRYSEQGHMVADSFDLVRGIDWAVSNGARVLNLSFAGARDKLLEEALSKAEEQGVVLVAASGNEGAEAPAAYPAAYASTIAVTATDQDDALYSFANRGTHVELAAPGVDVLVAAGADGFGLQTGTSMATAYISGAIALMLEKNPELSLDDIKQRLASSALDLGEEGRDPIYGHGLVNAARALEGPEQTAELQ